VFGDALWDDALKKGVIVFAARSTDGRAFLGD